MKYITNSKFTYDLLVGVAVSLQITFMLFGLNLVRRLYTSEVILLIDLAVLLLLGIAAVSEELITRSIFVR